MDSQKPCMVPLCHQGQERDEVQGKCAHGEKSWGTNTSSNPSAFAGCQHHVPGTQGSSRESKRCGLAVHARGPSGKGRVARKAGRGQQGGLFPGSRGARATVQRTEHQAKEDYR